MPISQGQFVPSPLGEVLTTVSTEGQPTEWMVDWARCHFGLLWCGIWSSTGLVSFQVEHHPGKPRVSFRGKTHYLTWFKAGLLNKRQAYVISSSFSQDGLGALLILVLGTKARAFMHEESIVPLAYIPSQDLFSWDPVWSLCVFVARHASSWLFFSWPPNLFFPQAPFFYHNGTFPCFDFFPLKKREYGTGEMAQWVKILVMPVPWLEFNP